MDEKQMTKGREAYRMMDEACNQLVQSGNWQRVGSSDIKLFLDMYVQALLLKMAQTTGEISGDMLTYIARVPARDILKIGQAAPQQALNIGFKNRSFAEGTPLLLRCCVAMDDKDGTATAQQFVDGVSRLLYAAADVDGDMSGNELNFITAYAGGLRTFLMTRAAGRHYDGAQEAVRRVDIPGGKQGGEFFGGGLVQHGQEGRAVALGLGRQALHITGAGQTPHAEEARFGLHHGQGVAPDGAGGAQNHQAARLFPLPALGGRPRNIVDRRTALARPEFCHQSVRINTVVSVALPRPEKNKKMEAPGKR